MRHSTSLLGEIVEKVYTGQRLSFEDGVELFRSKDILTLGRLANFVREAKNGNKTYYIRNRHINYTNICKNKCHFCAFYREEGQEDAYALPLEHIWEEARHAAAEGASETHIVGGVHPSLPFSYYLDMLKGIKNVAPQLHLQAFTAVEIEHFAQMEKISVSEVLCQLREAGLGSLPGGGAEVFSPRLRKLVCPNKISGEKWLQVMREAHNLGIRSNATMLYGHLETVEERVDHLLQLRESQDETGGFMSFIPLPFHPKNTKLEHILPTTGLEDLKFFAVSRLMLDNFPHIKAFWIMIGVKLTQVSQWFGVDDLDGTVVQERITHAAGAKTPQALPPSYLERLIREAGREPVERDTIYNPAAQIHSKASSERESVI